MARYTAKIRGQGALDKTIKSGTERGIQMHLESPMLEFKLQFGGPGGDHLTIWGKRPSDADNEWVLLPGITAKTLFDARVT
jgi:hypothetical protein